MLNLFSIRYYTLRNFLFAGFLLGLNTNIHSQTNCKCPKSIHIKKINFEDSLEVFKVSSELKTYPNKACLFNALNLELNYHLFQKKTRKTLNLIKKQEELLKTLNCNSIFKLNLSLNKTAYYRSVNNYENLSKFGIKTLELAEKQTDKYYEIETLKHLAWLYTRVDEDQKVWDYTKRAEQLIHNGYDNSYNSIKNYVWLGYEYESQYVKKARKSLIDSSWGYIQKAKAGAIKNNLTRESTKIYRALEALSYHKGDLKNALKFIDTAIYYGKKIKGSKNLSGLYLSKAWDHFDLGQFEEAEKWTDTMLKVDTKADIGGYMMTLAQAAELYEGTDNIEKAYSSYKKYKKLKDSLLDIERIKSINDLEKKYQTKLKDAKIKRLTVLLIVASLIIVSLFLIGAIIRLRRSKQQTKALKIAFEKQIALEKELSDVRDEIAQDFHDDLGNKFARISLLSKLVNGEVSLNDDKVKSKLEQITEDANGLYTGTRDFIFSLKSNSDYLYEVITYLSDFGEEFFKKTNIKFEVSKSIDFNQKLPYYWSKQLIYIFKEAMTNALKYSGSEKVILKFEFKNNELKIECIDIGIGIDTSNIKSENGLYNMRNRAEKIGGLLEVDSKPKMGTIIRFVGHIK